MFRRGLSSVFEMRKTKIAFICAVLTGCAVQPQVTCQPSFEVKKHFIGLTNDEITEILEQTGDSWDLAVLVETKLRGKNERFR